MPLVFAKYEGTKNDFVVIRAESEAAVPTARVVDLCDRRTGIGADGVLLVLPPRTADAALRMKVINADGSVPEMCGNGVRCVALDYARTNGKRRASVAVDTDAGLRTCIVDDEGDVGMVTVDMGIVKVLPDRDVAGITLSIVDAGNPHAIAFRDASRDALSELAPRIMGDRSFPAGTNVEFAEVREEEIVVVVWERGVGFSVACGTGACAVVAAARAKGLVPRDGTVRVNLPGGALEISIDGRGHTWMRGPARSVFSGEIA